MFIYVVMFILVALMLSPFVVTFSKNYSAKKAKRSLFINLASFFAICIILTVFPFTANAAEAVSTAAKYGDLAAGLGFLGSGLVMGMATIGAGIAVAAGASAAVGATSENPKMFGKAIIFVVLGEGIPVYALLVATQILNKI